MCTAINIYSRSCLCSLLSRVINRTPFLDAKGFLHFVASNKGHVGNGKRQGGVHGKAEALPTFTTRKAGRRPRQGGGSSNLHHRKGRAASTARRRLFQPSPPERQGGVHGKAEALPTFTTGKAGRCPRQGGGSSNLHHRKGRAVSTARRRLFQSSPPERQGGVHGKAEALPTFTTGKAGRRPRQGGGSSNLHHRLPLARMAMAPERVRYPAVTLQQGQRRPSIARHPLCLSLSPLAVWIAPLSW